MQTSPVVTLTVLQVEQDYLGAVKKTPVKDLKNIQPLARETVQLVKDSWCKHEDLSSNPRTDVKKARRCGRPIIPTLRGQRQGDP